MRCGDGLLLLGAWKGKAMLEDPEVQERQGAEAPAPKQDSAVLKAPDYEALHKEAIERATQSEKRVLELEQTVRSQQGTLKQRLSVQDELAAVRREQQATRELVESLAKRQASGEVDQLPQDVEAVRQRAAQQDAASYWQRGANQAFARLVEMAREDMGIGDVAALNTMPELGDAIALWRAGLERQDIAMLHESITEARKFAPLVKARVASSVPAPVATPPPTPPAPRPSVPPAPRGTGGAATRLFRTKTEAMEAFIAGRMSREDWLKDKDTYPE